MRISRLSRSRRTPAILRHAATAVVMLALAACRGDDAATGTANAQTTAPPARAGGLVPPAEVVIARPSSPYRVDSLAASGSVSGTVVTPTPLAAREPISTGRDSVVCGATVPDSSVVQVGNGLGGAVVWLDDIRRGRPLPIERRLELESDHCVLSPRVQAGVVQSAVNVLGHDAFRQHLHFMSGGEREARATVLLGDEEQVIPTNAPFSAPGLVIVRDADHPWPAAYIAVFDHPYFAVTAPNGSFTIGGVPPGRYTLRVWHERATAPAQTVDVPPSGSATVSLVLNAR